MSWPNQVRCPTDWLFTSNCSPPHIAAPQLLSVIGRRALPEKDFHLSDHLRLQAHECCDLSPLLIYCCRT
jgi:hypothetical protein